MSAAAFASFEAVMAEVGADAVALVPGANFRRVMGHDFHQNERPVLIVTTRQGRRAAVVPHLEMSAFEPLAFDGPAFAWRDEEGYSKAFARLAEATGPLETIAVEGQRMRVFEMRALEAAYPGTRIVDAQRAIARPRLTKTADEIARLRTAISISERALERTLGEVRVGMSEVEVEGVLMRHLFSEGADGLAFTPIVAAGNNSANSHAKARADYRLRPGDALLFDFGATHEGMLADITRTFFVREASDEARGVHAAVLAANAAGRAAARGGMTAGTLDDVVLRSLEASRFADRIRHKTGHGLGLEVHEEPYIMRGSAQVLEPGMVFTIEPGLYRSGEGGFGVRIEDDVVVTADGGIDCLTSFPRELRLVG